LRLYADRGQAPEPGDIAVETGIAPDRVAIVLHKLQSHDLIDLDQASDQIRLAYPFTEAATGHRVELNGHAFHALCAIDAASQTSTARTSRSLRCVVTAARRYLSAQLRRGRRCTVSLRPARSSGTTLPQRCGLLLPGDRVFQLERTSATMAQPSDTAT
jgi:hypothetical protein